jgi:hypothetical protein
MQGIRGAGASFGILAQPEANGIPDLWPLVVLDELASVQEDPLFAGLQKAVAPPVVPINNPCGEF